MKKIWILSSEAPDDITLINRNSLLSEVHFGGQYETVRLFDELSLFGFNVRVLDPSKINKDFILPDIAIIRNTNGNSIKNIRLLEKMNVRCINNFDAHLICADKSKQLKILSENNIPIPKTQVIDLPFYDHILDNISFPVVVKPISSRWGELVALCETPEDIYFHCRKIQNRFKHKTVLIQEFIDGPTIVAWTIGSVSMNTQIRTPKNNIKFFISNDKDIGLRLPYHVDDALNDLITRTVKILNIEISKIDILKSNDGYKICEVNSPGGFSGRDDYFNTNHARDIANYIRSII